MENRLNMMLVADYAKKCKRTKKCIYDRINKGEIKAEIDIYGVRWIDCKLYPPYYGSQGRKKQDKFIAKKS